MLQQVIVAAIGVAVAIYVVYRIMRIIRGKSSACHCGCGGCKSSSCCCDEKSISGENSKKKASGACGIGIFTYLCIAKR